MRYILVCCFLFSLQVLRAQVPVDLKRYQSKNGARVAVSGSTLSLQWPAGKGLKGHLVLDLHRQNALFRSIGLLSGTREVKVAGDLDPAFLLTVGKRDLISQNGWNIFFDKVPLKPHQTYKLTLVKDAARVVSTGSRTTVTIGRLTAPGFSGQLEITCYNGSPLFNVAAVVSTLMDSTAIVYDAGLTGRKMAWDGISFADVADRLQTVQPEPGDTARNAAVKYRTIIGQTKGGSLAVFPAPHQYFYPLDEAFNLKFTWYGSRYRNLVEGYGLGIRQDLYGDRRFVPWFNAPPGTQQRLNFFCLASPSAPATALAEVKKFTHGDTYAPLPQYKRMASHFHNEFIMQVVRANKPIPEKPGFVTYFENAGIDIVHLGEFHYTAHPKGPDSLRLQELQALFEQCRRLSSDRFLLLPGEEPNEFFGGHWLQLFPKPVYWIMARKEGQPFVTEDPVYGTVYRVANAAEMLELLHRERGLAWTAHPRTKGSTGYPDKYKAEGFFKSDRFLGAAWKPMPADLSLDRLGKRVLDLLDDMNNWGDGKKVLAEADLFTIGEENEMYAHMNVNYLQLDRLPSFTEGWQPVADALQKGKFFSTTGEVLIPSFLLNGKGTGDTAVLDPDGNARISFGTSWTFPLQYAELISGDGEKVYRHRINLDTTLPFGAQTHRLHLNLKGRKWVRLEVWDAAVNGAFTQTIYLQ
ncbi:MAG TPA: hypothetical protein VHK69_09880 [Chitinophagaceae bacterium]|nr:hypothetical protein [Chitinophagaceae bacterium]